MSDTARKIVYLIASGPTAWEDGQRVQGNTDLPLHEEGTQRVRSAIDDWLPEQRLRTVHAAPDEASRQTAALVAQRLGAAKVKPIEELAEMNLGLWQGLTEAELQDRYPKVFGRWRAEPAKVSVPEGESFEELVDRVAGALDRLIGRSDKEAVVLVLRPVVLKLCGAWLGGADPAAPFTLQTQTPPPVQRFEISKRAWRDRRPRRRKKRISA